MLVGSRADAINARALMHDNRWHRISPRPLVDERYALPEALRTHPDYSVAAETLSTWATETPAPEDYLPEQASLAGAIIVRIGGRSYRHTRGPGRVSEPAADVFRFEVRANDAENVSDSQGHCRRSELVCTGVGRGVGAETVWIAFTLILGPPAGMIPSVSGSWGLVHQWHHVDSPGVSRSPVLVMDCAKGQLAIRTRSSASLYPTGNGIAVTHHTTALPAQGVLTHVVIQATFGEVGHLQAWLNGAQVVNVDTPIGYYTDLTNGSGITELGYPHWGLYESNRSETDVIYIANPEWGTADLSARITAPLAVPDLSPWV